MARLGLGKKLMRYLVYQPYRPVNVGTPERPVWEMLPGELTVLPYTRENLRFAREEAVGEVRVEWDEECE